MRTYGRVWTEPNGLVVPAYSPGATPAWVEVDTDANGFDDFVYVTALVQTFKLNLNESPFYADWGIPAKPAVVQQVSPDFYATLIQQRFAGRFASLTISKVSSPTPTYNVAITTHSGVKITVSIPV